MLSEMFVSGTISPTCVAAGSSAWGPGISSPGAGLRNAVAVYRLRGSWQCATVDMAYDGPGHGRSRTRRIRRRQVDRV